MGWRFLRVWFVAGCHWSITNKSRQCHSLGEMMRRHSPWRVPTNASLKHSNLSSSLAVSCSSSIWVCQGARFLELLATRPYSLDQSAHHQISLRPQCFSTTPNSTHIYPEGNLSRVLTRAHITHPEPSQTPPQTCRVSTNTIGFVISYPLNSGEGATMELRLTPN